VPRWLDAEPNSFRLQPGASQIVRLQARLDRLRGRTKQITVTFVLDGGPDQDVEVFLEVKRRGLFG
jgi:hypothetical protein